MARIIRFVLISVLIVSLISVQSPCYAQNMLRKLGRGAANVATSVLEIPKSIQESFYDDGPVAASTYGILDGIYKFAVRTVVGVFEVATFPIPFPSEYMPIVEPEFLFSSDE
jgi:putative exosortase-associated protein (TIGR04073 family)